MHQCTSPNVPYTQGGTLTLIRHGESEANIVNKAIRDGVIVKHPESFDSVPDREIRLTNKGVEQAIQTGTFMSDIIGNAVPVIFSSDHVRAQETAALVMLQTAVPHAPIRIEPFLGERNWGHYHRLTEDNRQQVLHGKKRDPLNFAMPAGELLVATRQRARQFLTRLASRHSGQHIIAFSHGEFIEALWAEIFHMSTEDQREYFAGPEGNIRNCHVIQFREYTDSSGVSTFRELRQCNPYANRYDYWDWKPIVRKMFTAQDLLSSIERNYPKQGYEQWMQDQLEKINDF